MARSIRAQAADEAAEAHWGALAFPCSAPGCRRHARVAVRTFVQVADLSDEDILALAVRGDGEIITMQTEHGKLALLGTAHACAAHESVLLKVAAQKGDRFVVQIDRGAGRVALA